MEEKLNVNNIRVAFETILNQYLINNETDINLFTKKDEKLVLPELLEGVISELIEKVQQIFKEEPSVLKLHSPIVIVGDLHGQILDLLRIINAHGLPGPINYLFLGDIVDRGEFSLDTIVFICILKFKYPNNVYIIRGNHEFEQLSAGNGFKQEILSMFEKSDLFEKFVSMFDYLPIAATIGDDIVCVHAGIGPASYTLEQLDKIERPFHDYNDPRLCGIFWSDPTDSPISFQNSPRGMGYLFNEPALRSYLSKINKKLMIRGHQSTASGVEWTLDKHIVTVFSASNYCGFTGNYAATLTVDDLGALSVRKFQPIPYIHREDSIRICVLDSDHLPIFGSNGSDIRRVTSTKGRLVPLYGSLIALKKPISKTCQPYERKYGKYAPSLARSSVVRLPKAGLTK